MNIVIGFVLSPIIIGRLGAEQYGTWALLFSTVDYFRMLDFGFRAATVNACARFRSTGDWAGINRVASTSVAYFVGAAIICVSVVVLFREPLISALKVPDAFSSEAQTLLIVIAGAVALRLILAPLTAILEAFQRFDLVNHAYIVALLVRSSASLALLLSGFGLLEMAYAVLGAQLLEGVLTVVFVRRVFPEARFRLSDVDRSTIGGLFRFGRYSAVLAAANLVSIQAPTTVLGFLRGPLEVSFFSFPFRLLMSSAEGLAKVADVTTSVTAALDETRRTDQVWRVAVTVNRACFTLFMPLAIFLTLYGTELLRVWTPEIAEQSGPLIPILLVMFLFGVAGQYNAGAILIGQARHATYSLAVVAEVLTSIAILLVFGREYGAEAAAWAVSMTFVLNRGLVLAVLICRQNRFSLGRYLQAIYAAPLAVGVPVIAVAYAIKSFVLPGHGWLELIGAGGLLTGLYFGLAWFFVLSPDQRRVARSQATRFSMR